MNLDAQWIVGFVDGEGCFHISINNTNQVLPEFVVTQHEKDIQVLYALKSYFSCGVVRKQHSNIFCYRTRSYIDLCEKIIPFFEKHQLKTRKRVDFQKFRRILLMMQDKKHLTREGFDEICRIVKLWRCSKKKEMIKE